MMLDAVESISGRRAAQLLLHPLRHRIVEHARKPAGASSIARALGVPRQKVNYHLRRLARAGVVRRVGKVRRRGLYEQLYQASARMYVLSPQVLGPLAADAAQVGDAYSASYLLALAAQLQAELGRARSEAQKQGKRLATLSVNTEFRFESAEQQRRFAEGLTKAVTELVGRHTAPARSGRGRPYRLVIGSYPIPPGRTS
ncbi:MAG: helix-turn-helix domain-containing protein [Gemmatimonadales bacterium]